MNDSWVSAGFNDWCSVRLTPEKFEFQVNAKASKNFENFQDACDFTAKLMHQQFNDRPLYLALSGGLDSEVVANTFVRNNIPFTPLIFNLGTVNGFESWYAEYWCQQHHIEPLRLSISPDEYETVVKKYLKVIKNTHQTGIVAYLYLADYVRDLGGYYISGVGDINQDGNRFYTNIVDFSLDVWRPGQHPTGFFMYTPELALSYIKKFDYSVDEQYNKLSFYQVAPRPKFNWFEVLADQQFRVNQLIEFYYKHTPSSEPHWFESQQQIIELLK